MHLVLVISSLNSGGAERVLSELANYWISKGHQVSLLTLAHPDTEPFYPLEPGINLVQLDQSQSESSLLGRLGNIFKRISCLRKKFKSLKPDIILSFVDVMNLTTLLATTGLRIPVIVSERTHPAYHQLPLLYQKARRILYPKASKVVAQTISVAEYFKKLTNLVIISNAVTEPSNKKLNASKTVRQIISVGRLCSFKGFDILIRALARLYQEYPHLRLTIYGEGTERNNLQNLIESLHLKKKVFLPGTTQNIQQVLLEADLFVFPSHYEGFPNALAEAMAAGLPVIASNCSGNIEIVRDNINGRLFPVGDIERLTALMKELLNDQDQRKRLSKQAQTICDKFHQDRIYKLWDDVIKQALASNLILVKK